MDFKEIAFCAVTVAALFAAPLSAQETLAAGEVEYMQACASCHGNGGTGDGPLAQLMTVAVPDLTTISARNDSVFPLLHMIMTIDGRTGIRGHGYPMPVWGDRYAAEIGDAAGTYGAEVRIRGRVLVLAEYLESIQQ